MVSDRMKALFRQMDLPTLRLHHTHHSAELDMLMVNTKSEREIIRAIEDELDRREV